MSRNNNQNLILKNVQGDGANTRVCPRIIQVSHVSDATNITYSTSQLLGGMTLRYHPGANDTLPTGSDFVDALNDPPVGEAFDFYIRNMATSDIIVNEGVGVSLLNDPVSISTLSGHKFKGIITGDGTVDIYGLGELPY